MSWSSFFCCLADVPLFTGTLRTLLGANSLSALTLLDRKPKAATVAPKAASKGVASAPDAKPAAPVTKAPAAKAVLKPATAQTAVPRATTVQTPKAPVSASAHSASIPHATLPAHAQPINRKS
jgi:hypothetical protein